MTEDFGDDAVAQYNILRKFVTQSEPIVTEFEAACVNILPGICSIYRWQGKISNDAEVLIVIKSLASRFEELESWLLEHHPYDIPEIVALPVSCVSAEYHAWIDSVVDPAPIT